MIDSAALPPKLLRSIDRDHMQSAKAVSLAYVSDKKEGIARLKNAKGYSYSYKGEIIKDEDTIARIKKLAIPPSWTNVWISPNASGHLQATGTDLNGRKQYRYHANWNEIRNQTKFHRLLAFGKALPMLRKKINKNLREKNLTADKVIATAIRLMEETSIRVGNNGYEKMYGSYGLTTLKDRHVIVKNGRAEFSFVGKKGVPQKITLKNKKLANIVKQCRDIPGKELFQYYDKDGGKRVIDSGMVNDYIKNSTNGEFSSKDLRTWSASVEALKCLLCFDEGLNQKERKAKIVSVLDQVSGKLGNTRTVCKKYYVHPALLSLYEEDKLSQSVSRINCNDSTTVIGLSKNEKILMKLLKKRQ